MTLEEAIREYQEDGYEVTHVVESVCGGCGGREFEVQVTDASAPRPLTVGLRCLECGLCGVHEDWKIDYVPSRHLITQA